MRRNRARTIASTLPAPFFRASSSSSWSGSRTTSAIGWSLLPPQRLSRPRGSLKNASAALTCPSGPRSVLTRCPPRYAAILSDLRCFPRANGRECLRLERLDHCPLPRHDCANWWRQPRAGSRWHAGLRHYERASVSRGRSRAGRVGSSRELAPSAKSPCDASGISSARKLECTLEKANARRAPWALLVYLHTLRNSARGPHRLRAFLFCSALG